MSREGNLLLEVETRSADDTRLLGQALVPFLQAGDLVILEGELGAGKTTLTQGIGAGLRVNQRVTSPTFIIARSHTKSPDVPGPNLVHVDAYRLMGGDDVETLDLESALETAVVVVEWGTDKVEGLSAHCLKLSLCRPESAAAPVTGTIVDLPEDTTCQVVFRSLEGTWDLSGLVQQWEALRAQADASVKSGVAPDTCQPGADL